MTPRNVSEPEPPPSSTSDPDALHPQGGTPATDVIGQPGGNINEANRNDEGTAYREDSP